jgi:enoyl-CoA hydratase/carnithine racemase
MWPAEVHMIERISHGTVHELRLQRPPVNALSPELLQAVADGVREAPRQGAEAVVLSGGEGVFSGGLDLPVLVELDRTRLEAALEIFFDAMAALAESKVPVVAAITGHSPAGGAVLAMFCDWRVMAAGKYVIGLNEVRIGFPMPVVVADVATRIVGPRHAETLCVTGELMSPERALEIGLVDAVAPPEKVVAEAIRWCEKCLESPPDTLAATRATMRGDLVELVARSRSSDLAAITALWFEPAMQRGLRAVVDGLKKK